MRRDYPYRIARRSPRSTGGIADPPASPRNVPGAVRGCDPSPRHRGARTAGTPVGVNIAAAGVAVRQGCWRWHLAERFDTRSKSTGRWPRSGGSHNATLFGHDFAPFGLTIRRLGLAPTQAALMLKGACAERNLRCRSIGPPTLFSLRATGNQPDCFPLTHRYDEQKSSVVPPVRDCRDWRAIVQCDRAARRGGATRAATRRVARGAGRSESG